jgi:WD40 repeat protein
MQVERCCTRCAAPLTSIGQDELCPGCLLEAGLETSQPVDSLNGNATVSAKPGWPMAGRFGDYELVEEIARGGVGVVYRARQLALGRSVALKLLLSGPLATPEMVQRFRAEASLAASLQHPNIVAIHEVGFCDGQHFIAMDYVPGRSLADILREGPLDARRAAAYVKTVAEAVHFAHERKILHRDLKPSNVLVDEFDAPRVTDFGLARRLDAETVLTLSGQVLGSPSYMAPEQAEARRGQVGRPTDVYSLGAILYHLVAGRPPFAAGTVPGTLHEVLHTQVVSPRLLTPDLPRDLETICQKCLEKEPARRYATAQELADELARFLRGEPTRARPVTIPERALRWAKRKPALAAMIVLVHLVAAVGLIGILWQWQRAGRNAREARAQRDVAEGRAYAAQMRLAYADFRAGKIGSARERLEAWIPGPGRADLPDWRGFEWRWLHRLCAASPSEIVATNASGFAAVAVSPNGHLVALGANDGTIRLLDARTGAAVTSWCAHPSAIDGLEFIPGTRDWLVTVGGDDMLLKIWSVREPRLLVATNCSRGMLAHAAVSPTGRFLAAGAPQGDFVNVWELNHDPAIELPRLILKRRCAGSGPSTFSPDENTLAVLKYSDFRMALWDLNSGRLLGAPKPEPSGPVRPVVFSPDGQWVVTCAGNKRVMLWPVNDLGGEGRILEANAEVRSLEFSADGKVLFAATFDENLQAWAMDALDRPIVMRGHSDGVNSLACTTNRPALFSASHDGTARRWRADATALEGAAEVPAEFEVVKAPADNAAAAYCLTVSPDQRHLAVSFIYELQVFDLVSGQVKSCTNLARAFGTPGASALSVAFSSEGAFLALGGEGGWVALLDATTLEPVRKPLQVLGEDRGVSSLAFGHGGRRLLSGGWFGGEMTVTDVQSRRVLRSIPAAGNLPRQPIAVSPDGESVAMASPGHRLTVQEIESGRLLAVCPQTVRFLGAVVFSPDAVSVAFTDESGAVFLWNLTGQRPIRRGTGHRGSVLGLAFSPDGRTLASGGMDHSIRLWHPDLDQEVAILAGHTSVVFSLAFAAHGDGLASIGMNTGEVLLWRAAPMTAAERR